MKTQIINGDDGNPAGVFIPIEDWERIKSQFPNIDQLDKDIPDWQKDLLDERLEDLNKPGNVHDIEKLLKFIDESL